MLRRLAPAKVNLSLHVTGQRSDGYHLLDSLVCFADVGDWVSLKPSDKTRLSVSGPFASGVPTDASNLILKALALIENAPPVALHLEKNLPAASGIGGGSADAAATLRLLAEFTGGDVPEDVARLGADVPVCLNDAAVRMQGVGEVINPVPTLPRLPAVLVNPAVAVATPPVFKALKKKDNFPMGDVPAFESRGACIDWLSQQRNDLQAPAISKLPQISDVLVSLSGAPLARMSGSGATCFGLFESEEAANATAVKISEAHPDWWVVPCWLN